MVKARVEFVLLGEGGWAEAVLSDSVGAGVTLNVTTTATAAENRPVTPVFGSRQIYARVTAIDGPIHVESGVDPTASLTNGLRLLPNVPEVMIARKGAKFSFIAEP